MAKPEYSKRASRFFGLVISLYTLASAHAQGPIEVSFISENEKFVVGQALRLQLRLPDLDPSQFTGFVPKLSDELFLVSGPSTRASTWALPNGRILSGTLVSYTLSSRRTGIYVLEQGVFQAGGKRYQIAPFIVSVVSAEESTLRFPLEVAWIRPSEVYAGQTFFLALEVKNLEFVPEPSLPNFVVRQDALVSVLATGGELRQRRLGSYQLLDLTWAKWLITPIRSQIIVIPPLTINVAGVRKITPELAIPIRPIPGENPTEAVGQFERNVKVERGLDQSDLVVIQQLRGLGNFPIIKFPSPRLVGFVILNESEEQNYQPTTLGYQGSVEKRYYLKSLEVEERQIVVPSFTYFNPLAREVLSLDPVPVALGNLFQQNAQAPQEVWEWPSTNAILQQRYLGLLFQPLAYLLLLPGVAFLVFHLFFRRPVKKENNPGLGGKALLGLWLLGGMTGAPMAFESEFERGRQSYQKGRWEESLGVVEALIRSHPDLPLLRYPAAILLMKLGREAEAIRELVLIRQYGFWNDDLQKLKTNLEERTGVRLNLPPLPPLGDDVVFWIIVVGSNLGLVFLARGLRGGSVLNLGSSAIVFLGLVSALSLWSLSDGRKNDQLGVIGPQPASLRRIPDIQADAWIALNKGTLVQIKGRANNYLRLETGDGVEGWVLEEDVLMVYFSR